jgi:hypothetical protein
MMYMNVSSYVYLYYVNSRGKYYLSPKSQSLLDYVDWLKKLYQYGSAGSLKEVTGQGHPSPTNDVTVSVVGSVRHWESDHYPITLVSFERSEIYMSCLILCSILCFIHFSFILYTSKPWILYTCLLSSAYTVEDAYITSVALLFC